MIFFYFFGHEEIKRRSWQPIPTWGHPQKLRPCHLDPRPSVPRIMGKECLKPPRRVFCLIARIKTSTNVLLMVVKTGHVYPQM